MANLKLDVKINTLFLLIFPLELLSFSNYLFYLLINLLLKSIINSKNNLTIFSSSVDFPSLQNNPENIILENCIILINKIRFYQLSPI
jgi:hypothetical protein